MKYIDALTIAAQLVKAMRPHCDRIDIAGSIRRQKAEVKDIEIVAIAKTERRGDPNELFDNEMVTYNYLYEWARLESRIQWIKPGTSEIEPWPPKPDAKYLRGLLAGTDIKLDLFICRPENWGVIYAIRTGSDQFSTAMVTHIRDNTEYRVRDGYLTGQDFEGKSGEVVPCREELDFFTYAGVKYVEPKFRKTRGDVQLLKYEMAEQSMR